jgi:hypothetical protein
MHAIDEPHRFQPHRSLPNPRFSVHVDRVAAGLSLCREPFTSDWRYIMFAYCLEKLGEWIERAEERRRHEYLSQSSDLVDLERRMRVVERDGYPV